MPMKIMLASAATLPAYVLAQQFTAEDSRALALIPVGAVVIGFVVAGYIKLALKENTTAKGQADQEKKIDRLEADVKGLLQQVGALTRQQDITAKDVSKIETDIQKNCERMSRFEYAIGERNRGTTDSR